MIVTVTPNPSIDRTLRIPSLTRGSVNRAASATAEAAGKGINVARALAIHGHAALAVVPLSVSSAAAFSEMLGDTVRFEAVTIGHDVRVNVSLVEQDGTVTKINEPGPQLEPDDVDAIIARTEAFAKGADWVVACGSLPPGAPTDLYARLADSLGSGIRLAVDAEGEALRASIGERVALIKPNHDELEGLVGHPIQTLGGVVAAAAGLVEQGVQAVLVSLGPDGAVLVDRDGASHAEANIGDMVNSVGAGDALLAGYLAAGGGHAALGPAVAWSVAACRTPGTQMRAVQPEDLAAVTVNPGPRANRRLAA
jgi:1-phosphofructokinase family hexose kinase